MKKVFAVVAVASVLILAGCGSSSSSTTKADSPVGVVVG